MVITIQVANGAAFAAAFVGSASVVDVVPQRLFAVGFALLFHILFKSQMIH